MSVKDTSRAIYDHLRISYLLYPPLLRISIHGGSVWLEVFVMLGVDELHVLDFSSFDKGIDVHLDLSAPCTDSFAGP
jgi:hypothetical protein